MLLFRIEKCIRILKTFTEEGVQQTETKEVTDAQTGQKVKKSQKVLKKIPSSVIRQAKGSVAQLGPSGKSSLTAQRLTRV